MLLSGGGINYHDILAMTMDELMEWQEAAASIISNKKKDKVLEEEWEGVKEKAFALQPPPNDWEE